MRIGIGIGERTSWLRFKSKDRLFAVAADVLERLRHEKMISLEDEFGERMTFVSSGITRVQVTLNDDMADERHRTFTREELVRILGEPTAVASSAHGGSSALGEPFYFSAIAGHEIMAWRCSETDRCTAITEDGQLWRLNRCSKHHSGDLR